MPSLTHELLGKCKTTSTSTDKSGTVVIVHYCIRPSHPHADALMHRETTGKLIFQFHFLVSNAGTCWDPHPRNVLAFRAHSNLYLSSSEHQSRPDWIGCTAGLGGAAPLRNSASRWRTSVPMETPSDPYSVAATGSVANLVTWLCVCVCVCECAA